MSVTASNVGQNMGVVMPTTVQVADGVVYGWPDTREGTLDPGATGPAAPVITGVVDDGNADSVTVSLTTTPQTNTLQLYYRQKSITAWTTGLTRVGDGDIVQTGLIAGTWYEMYATASNGTESAPSNLVTIYLASTVGTGTIKTAIFAILNGDDDVTGITGRLTPGGDPAKTGASVTYHRISAVRDHTMDGPDDLVTPTIQVNSYDTTDFKAELLSDKVRNALDGFSGTVNGVSISYMAMRDEGDIDDFEPSNKQISRHGVRQDYEVTYTEL